MTSNDFDSNEEIVLLTIVVVNPKPWTCPAGPLAFAPHPDYHTPMLSHPHHRPHHHAPTGAVRVAGAGDRFDR
jgi:hypothetical protein